MGFRWLERGARTARRRLGLGAILAGALHLAAGAVLLLLVTRAGRSLVGGDGLEGDRVDVSTIGEPAPGLPGRPPTGGPPGAGETAPTGPRATETSPAGPLPKSIAPRPRRVLATPGRTRSAAAPVKPAAVGAPRTVSRAMGAPTLATTTPTAIDVGADGDRSPIPGAVGPAGPSGLAAFRAELKRRMRSAWRAREIYHRIDPHGQLQGTLLITRLDVRLRADGTVEKAAMHDSSGIAALDTEAMGAIRRMKPLSRLPAEILDPQQGVLVSCAFHLDLGQYRFANHLRRAVAELWRPARAYMASSDQERVTRVRLMLSRDGRLQEASVIAPSGIDFLDSNALAWAKQGTPLPQPPPAFHRAPGLVPVFVAFYHLAGQVHFLWPREDTDD